MEYRERSATLLLGIAYDKSTLQIGHRISVDIDLFSDAPYGTLDFPALEAYLREQYTYVSRPVAGDIGLGSSYIIGQNPENAIKLDLYYTDAFIHDAKEIDGIRLATVEEITAMKLHVVQQKGRKKDFWDLHAIMDQFSIEQMLAFHEERYPFSNDRQQIIRNFTDFGMADDDFDPTCLLGKHWEIIRLEIAEAIAAL